jgi:guanylate kinase
MYLVDCESIINSQRDTSRFVKPPSVDELKKIKERSTESEDKINMRIAKASVELATAPQFDVIIKLRFAYSSKKYINW